MIPGTFDKVVKLHAFYIDQCFDLALDRHHYDMLLIKLQKDVADDSWTLFDRHNDCIVSSLEVLAAFAIFASRGMIRDKADFLFGLFDLRDSGSLDYDSLYILLSSALSGTVKLSGRGQMPDDSIVEKSISRAFLEANKNMSASLTLDEYRSWLILYLDLDNQQLEVSEILTAFDVLEESPIFPDCFVSSSPVDRYHLQERQYRDVRSTQQTDGLLGLSRQSPGFSDSTLPIASDPARSNPKDMIRIQPVPNAAGSQRVEASIASGTSLSLEYSYGSSASSSASNVIMLASGEIVYALAKLVVMAAYAVVAESTKVKVKQRFYRLHEEPVTALAVHPEGRIVASGETGHKGSIHIWDADNQQADEGGNDRPPRVLAVFKDPHRQGVAHLAFSASGQYLASVSRGGRALLLVHDIQQLPKGSRKATRPSPAFHKMALCMQTVHDICWAQRDDVIVTAGDTLIFWTGIQSKSGGGLRRLEGQWGKKAIKQTILCVREFAGSVRTGLIGGQVYAWEVTGDTLERQAVLCLGGPTLHDGAVSCLCLNGMCLVSGGQDGVIKQYKDSELAKPVAEYRVPVSDNVGSRQNQRRLRGLCTHENRQIIVIATESGDIYLLTAAGLSHRLVYGTGSVCDTAPTGALGRHKSKPWVVCGANEVLHLIDVELREVTATRHLPCGISAMTYTPDSRYIAVGLGNQVSSNSGNAAVQTLRISDTDTLQTQMLEPDLTEPVCCLEYTEDGCLLASACRTSKGEIQVSVYNAAGDVISKRFSFITEVALRTPCLTFTSDGAYLRASNMTPDGCLAHASVVDTTAGHSVQGSRAGVLQFKEEEKKLHKAISGLLVCGEDAMSGLAQYRAHINHQKPFGRNTAAVMTVMTADRKRLISFGTQDHALLIWRVNTQQSSERSSKQPAEALGVDRLDEEIACLEERSWLKTRPDAQARWLLSYRGGLGSLILKGDILKAMPYNPNARPWQAFCHAPDRILDEISSLAPSRRLTLNFVYGSNVSMLGSSRQGHSVYLAGRTALVYDPKTHKQVHLAPDSLHCTPSCWTITRSGQLAAIGQLQSGDVVLWSIETVQLISRIQTAFVNGVGCMAFYGEDILAVVSQGPRYQVAIYDTAIHPEGIRLAFAQSALDSPNSVKCLSWLDRNKLATCSTRHLTFWEHTQEKVLEQRQARVDQEDGTIRDFMSVVGVSQQGAVTGHQDGSVKLWTDGVMKSTLMLTSSPITSLLCHDHIVFGAAQNGLVYRFAPDLGSVDVCAKFDVAVARMIPSPVDSSHLLAISNEGDAWDVQIKDAADTSVGPKRQLLERQASSGQRICAMACHPHSEEYATGSEDGQLTIWSAASHKSERTASLVGAIGSLAYNGAGDILVAGIGLILGPGGSRKSSKKDEAGSITIHSPDDLTQLAIIQVGQSFIACLRFAPDDGLLAVAAEDSSVFLLDTQAGFIEKGLCKAPSGSEVIAMDFTENGKFLQLATNSQNVWHFSTTTYRRLKPESTTLRNEPWASWSSPFGWPVQSTWVDVPTGVNVTSVERSRNGKLIACTDDAGRVRVFRWPCIEPCAMANTYRGHDELASCCRWMHKDKYLLVLSEGNIFQWQLCGTSDESGGGNKSSTRSLIRIPPRAREDTAALNDLLPQACGQASPAKKLDDHLDYIEPLCKPTIREGLPETDDLELEYVHGLSNHGCRVPLAILGNDSLVYAAATLVVLQKVQRESETEKQQRFYSRHTDAVSALTVHSDGRTVASAHFGPCPEVHIWDSASLVTLQVLRGLHRSYVGYLAFPPYQERVILTVGMTEVTTIALYNWQDAQHCLRQYSVPAAESVDEGLHSPLSCWYNGRYQISERDMLLGQEDVCRQKHGGLCAIAVNAGSTNDLAIAPNGAELCCVGSGSIRFHQLPELDEGQPPQLDPEDQLGAGLAQQDLLSVVYLVVDTVIIGTASGQLFCLKGRRPCQVVQIQCQPVAVQVLQFLPGQQHLLVGDSEGTVTVLSAHLERLSAFSLRAWRELNRTVGTEEMMHFTQLPRAYNVMRSMLPCHASEDRIVIVTAAVEAYIWTRSTDDVETVLSPHPAAITALASHPQRYEYVTADENGSVRIWNGLMTRLMSQRQMKRPVTSAAYTPDGTSLAIAMCEGDEEQTGDFIIVRADSLQTVRRPTGQVQGRIADMRYSPDGSLLALVAEKEIYVLEVSNDFNRRGSCSGHRYPISNTDFSVDSQYLQSSSRAATDGTVREVLYWQLSTCRRLPAKHTPALRQVSWATCSLPDSWAVQGYTRAMGSCNVASVERSKDGRLLVVMDKYGKIRISSYPCLDAETTLSYQYRGHTGPSNRMQCRWLLRDTHLITVAGQDSTVMQWRHIRSRQPLSGAAVLPRPLDVPYLEQNWPERSPVQISIDERTALRIGGQHGMEGLKNTRITGHNHPLPAWLPIINPPSNVIHGTQTLKGTVATARQLGGIISTTQRPIAFGSFTKAEATTTSKLGIIQLSWIHGYRGGSVGWLANCCIVYACGKVAIVYDASLHTQRYFYLHTDVISSLTVGHEGRYVATGQVGHCPGVYIWDNETLHVVALLRGRLEKGVAALAFSTNGDYLACIGGNSEHTVAIYLWRSEYCLALGSMGRSGSVLCMAWSPNDKTVVIGCLEGIHFFTFKSTSRYLRRRQGSWSKRCTIQPVLSCVYLPSAVCVTGMYDGSLYFWEDNICRGIVSACAKGLPVRTLAISQAANVLISGIGGQLIVWDADSFEEGQTGHELLALQPECEICALDCRSLDVLYGTNQGQVRALRLPHEKGMGAKGWKVAGPLRSLVDGHGASSVTATSMHPRHCLEYVTGGADKTLLFWHAGRSVLLRQQRVEGAISALAYSPDGALLAVGMGVLPAQSGNRTDEGEDLETAGVFLVLDSHSLNVVFQDKPAKGSMRCLQWSIEGSLLACGAQDCQIYLYQIHSEGSERLVKLRYAFTQLTAPVTAIDFSVDSRFLQACSAPPSRELLYWNTMTGKHLTHGGTELKDVRWSGWTLPYGWPVRGLWSIDKEEEQNVEITQVDKMRQGSMVAAVDDHGRLRLYAWPVEAEGRTALTCQGHAPLITACRWSVDDRMLVSCGGEDGAVFQWNYSEK